jgi:hypothetical protein
MPSKLLAAWVFIGTVAGCAQIGSSISDIQDWRRINAAEVENRRMQAFMNQCRAYGFSTGSREMSQCLMNLDVQHKNREALQDAVRKNDTEQQCRARGGMWLGGGIGCTN